MHENEQQAEDSWNKRKTEDRIVTSPSKTTPAAKRDKTCTNCKGTGVVIITQFGKKGKLEWVESPCPICTVIKEKE